MNVEVAIPWRNDGGHREKSLQGVIESYSKNYPISLVDSGHEPFNRAASRNRAIALSTADVVILTDADILVEKEPLTEAIEIASSTDAVAKPYDRIRCLSPDGTDSYWGGSPLLSCHAEQDYTSLTGGVFIVRPRVWRDIGGMDPRIATWGFEDRVFLTVLRMLAIPHPSVVGTAHHLWHPPAAPWASCNYRDSTTWPAWLQQNAALLGRYEAATSTSDIRAIQKEYLVP